MFAIDFTGTEAMEGLALDLRHREVALRLARVHRPVLVRLRSAGVIDEIGEDAVFEQVADAVADGS